MVLAPGGPSLALLVIAGVNSALAGVALRRRDVRGALPFAAMLLCVSVYAIGDAVRFASTTLGAYRFGTLVSTAGMLGLAPTNLWFAVAYSGRDSWIDRRLLLALLIEPVVVYALALTAPMHDLLWTLEGFVRPAPFAMVAQTFGPVFWLNVAYEYAIIVASMALVGFVAIRRSDQYRVQATLLVFGAAVPLAASTAWILDLVPVGNMDPTPFAFTVTGVAFTVALFRFGLLDLVPIARHTLVEEMADPMIVVDGDDRMVDFNPAAARVFDVEDDAIGRPVSAVVPSLASLDDGGGRLAGTTGTGVSDFDDSDVVVRTDGSDRYFDVERSQLTDGAGSTMGRLVIFRDVSDRRAVEQRFQRLIVRSSDVVTVLDETGTITYVSPTIENVLGYAPDELVGEHVTEHLHPDDRERIAGELADHADDPGYAGTFEVKFRHADGGWRVVESRAKNLLDDPYVEGIVLNSRDVTERRRRERKLRAQNERLEEFTSMVAHDLRNPLSVLSGRLELARDTGDPEHLDEAVESVRRMESIIDDLRRLARQGRAVEDPESLDLSRTVREAWKIVPTGDAELVCTTDATVRADESMLSQALENLFRNAIEHGTESTEDGASAHRVPDGADGERSLLRGGDDAAGASGREPSVTVRVGDLPNGFYVEDDGPGLPGAGDTEVFEYGYSGGEGTGLGLAIVRRIVEAHGWTVTATESDLGGARFEITGV